MITENGHGLGRIERWDPNNSAFPLSSILTTPEEFVPPRPFKYSWTNGWWGNQGSLPHCVAYMWLHAMADGPLSLRPRPCMVPERLYCMAQQRDPWPGDCATPPHYDGSSVLAGAQVLHEEGLIESYWWATTFNQAIRALFEGKGVGAGTVWTKGMSEAKDGFARMTGPVEGGHAYWWNGIRIPAGYSIERAIREKVGWIRFKNSWGRDYGNNGFANLSMGDAIALYEDHGELVVPVYKKAT